MEDNGIVELFWERNENAIKETEQKYGRRLQGLSYHILQSKEDAEECVSDTMLTAWNTIPPQRPTYFFAYLSKICRYVSFGRLDWKNAQKRKAEVVSLTEEMESCIPAPMLSDDESMTSEEIGRMINNFLAGLTEEKRLIFMRRYWYGDSIECISKRYCISESKVKTTLFRLREKLKKYIEKEGGKL